MKISCPTIVGAAMTLSVSTTAAFVIMNGTRSRGMSLNLFGNNNWGLDKVSSSFGGGTNIPQAIVTEKETQSSVNNEALQSAVNDVERLVTSIEKTVGTKNVPPAIAKAEQEMNTALRDLQDASRDGSSQELLVKAEKELETAIVDFQKAIRERKTVPDQVVEKAQVVKTNTDPKVEALAERSIVHKPTESSNKVEPVLEKVKADDSESVLAKTTPEPEKHGEAEPFENVLAKTEASDPVATKIKEPQVVTNTQSDPSVSTAEPANSVVEKASNVESDVDAAKTAVATVDKEETENVVVKALDPVEQAAKADTGTAAAKTAPKAELVESITKPSPESTVSMMEPPAVPKANPEAIIEQAPEPDRLLAKVAMESMPEQTEKMESIVAKSDLLKSEEIADSWKRTICWSLLIFQK